MRGKITTVPLPSFYCPQGLIPHNIWVSNKIKDIPCHHYQHSAVWTYFITSAFVSFGIHVFGPVSHVFPVNYIHVHCVGQWDIVCLHVNTGGGVVNESVYICLLLYVFTSVDLWLIFKQLHNISLICPLTFSFTGTNFHSLSCNRSLNFQAAAASSLLSHNGSHQPYV